MEKILVFGHKSPDTDTICSSIVMADLQRKVRGIDSIVPCRLGEINEETQYALNYFKAEVPEYMEKVEEGQCVILVDHNEFSQSVDGIEEAKVDTVVDHHRINNFKTAEPLYYYAQPVGCTSTLLFEIYKLNNNVIEPQMAGLMLSAIISDTLLLKSPTTTVKDKKAVEELAKIADVDVNTYGLEMLKAGTNLEKYTETELETKIINNLEKFLLELGKGFTFVGRQYRILIDNTYYYADLVFYHRILRCFVIIDLKVDKVKHEDIRTDEYVYGIFCTRRKFCR